MSLIARIRLWFYLRRKEHRLRRTGWFGDPQ
jgi:hypothetical protein